MFRLLKKWTLLPRADRFMLLKVFCLMGMVRVLILLLPFKWIAKHLGHQGIESSQEEDSVKREAARKIGRAIAKISRYTPWESKCLVQAITGKILMRKMGISNTLYLGVRKNEKNELVAHAWLRVGPAIISGRHGRDEFKVVSCFSEIMNDPKQ